MSLTELDRTAGRRRGDRIAPRSETDPRRSRFETLFPASVSSRDRSLVLQGKDRPMGGLDLPQEDSGTRSIRFPSMEGNDRVQATPGDRTRVPVPSPPARLSGFASFRCPAGTTGAVGSRHVCRRSRGSFARSPSPTGDDPGSIGFETGATRSKDDGQTVEGDRDDPTAETSPPKWGAPGAETVLGGFARRGPGRWSRGIESLTVGSALRLMVRKGPIWTEFALRGPGSVPLFRGRRNPVLDRRWCMKPSF